MAIDFSRSMRPGGDNRGFYISTYHEDDRVDLDALLVAQKITDYDGDSISLLHKMNFIFNSFSINTERFVRHEPLGLAFVDMYNFGYLQGVRAEREKRRKKISKGE